MEKKERIETRHKKICFHIIIPCNYKVVEEADILQITHSSLYKIHSRVKINITTLFLELSQIILSLDYS